MKEYLKSHICRKLNKLADEHNIKILHAIESGSRAWGFPSKDSDYDVRFIYVRDLDHYLSVDRKRDVIETPILHDQILKVDFDMNGWDLKKAIYLALRGNAVVNEWLTSPVQYIGNIDFQENLQEFISEVGDLKAYFHFYRNYMRQPWESYREENAKEIRIKHYCYVLRCALALAWLENKKTPPPMDVPSLLKGGGFDQELINQIDFLIAKKAEASEADKILRNKILDDFIDNAIFEERQRPSKDDLEGIHLSKANQLFKKIVLQNNSV